MRAPRDLKPRPLSVSLARLSSAVAICATILAARGATLVWDGDATGGNNAASGAGLGGSGTWDNLTTSNWWGGGATDTTWSNAGLHTAVFAGAAGTVNLGAPITAGNLVFNTSDYVLAGSPLTLGTSPTVSAIVNLQSRSGNAVNATINSQLAANSTTGITLNGNGGTLTLNFTGTHAATGPLTIRSGTLQVNGATSVLNATTGVTFRGSGAFRLDNFVPPPPPPTIPPPPSPISYSLGALTNTGGDGVLQIQRTDAADVQLTFSSLGARSVGATGVFAVNGNGANLSSNAKFRFTAGVGSAFMPGFVAKSEGAFAGFAFYDAGGFVRPMVYDAADPAAFTTATQFVANSHNRVASALPSQNAQTIRSLAIVDPFNVPLTGLLTIAADGIAGTPTDVGSVLKVGGGNSTISGAGGITAGLARELIFRPDAEDDTLTISTAITSTTGAVTKSGDGTLILSNASNAFVGTTYVNGGRLTIRGAGAAGGAASTEVVMAGGTYELLGYGVNDASIETIATGKNVTVTGTGTLTAGRLTPATDQAANKTLSFGNLTIGNQVLTADPAVYVAGVPTPPHAGAYFLSFTGTTTFTDTLPATFNVTGTQASGTTPALTLGGVVSSTSPVGFIKRGTGTLALGNAGNLFGGAGAVIELQEGVLSIATDGALGNAANSILLNAGDPTDGLLTTGTFATPRNVALGQALNSIEVVGGTTLTLNGLVTSNIPADLVKRGAGKLSLTNTLNSFGGVGSVIDLQGGILETSTSGALGNAANTVKLSAGSFSAIATFIAPQNFLLGQAANTIEVVGAGNTLTISGVISSESTLANLTKTGAGSLTLTNAGNSFGGAGSILDIQGATSTLTANSGGALGDPANAVKLGGDFVGNGTSTASQKFTLAKGLASTVNLTVTAGNTFGLAGVVENDGANTVNVTKLGPGTLELTNVNTFGGAGRTITVSAGTLAAETDPSLGAAGNAITLNGGGFRAIGTFSTGARPFTLGGASNSIAVSQGNTLTIGSAFTVAPVTNGLVKSDLGTLVLTAAQAGWTGQITINAGAIRASGANANILGATAPAATANTVISLIGGLELTGGVTVAEPLTINTPGDNTTMVGSNFGGVLRTVLATAGTYSGAITVNGVVADNTFRSVVFGADTNTTFTLSAASTINFANVAGANRVTNLILAGESTNSNTLASTITRTAGTTLGLLKTGKGNWVLAPTTVPQIDSVVVRSGILQANANLNAAGVLPATTSLTFTGSSTFRHDNVTAFAGIGRSLGALTFSDGDGVVRNERSANFNSFLTFDALQPRLPGATGLFWVNGNTATFGVNAKISFNTGPTVNTFLGSGYFAQANSTATGFAWFDTGSFVRTISYSAPIDTNAVTIASGNLSAGKYMRTTGAGAVGLAASTGVLSLHMAGTNVLTVGASQVLTINAGGTDGGLLKTGGAGTIVGAGSLSAGGAANELIIRTDLVTDTLAISIPITNTGALTKSGLGDLTLTGTQSWTGGTFVNGGRLVIQGTGALGGSAVLGLSGGAFSFQADGDGSSKLETLDTLKNVTVDGADAGLTVGRLAAVQALNKTVTFANLSIANQALLATANNGYGIRFTGPTNFTEALPPTINVAGTQASNVVSGVTLAGVVSSSGVGLIKAGAGTLVLENAGNTFGSTGGLIDIQGGVLAAGSDGALGHPGNNVALNVISSTQGFRAIGTFATDRIFSLNTASNQIEVTQGNVFTLNKGLNLGGASASTNVLSKNNNGVLELGGDSPATWTGAIALNAGAIRIKTAIGLGSTTHVALEPVIAINNPGAALQLSGVETVYSAYPIRLTNGGINNGGALENVSGDNLWTGPISLNADGAVIGSSAGTLRISGGIASSTTTARSLFLAGAGNISLITTPLPATVATITKIGSGTATLGVASTSFVSNLVVNAGTFALSGAGRIGGTGNITLNPGGVLSVTDSGTPTANRLGSRTVNFRGGSLNLVGSGIGNTTETIPAGEAVFGRGLSTITVTAGVGRNAVVAFTGQFNNVAPAQNTGADTGPSPDVGPPTATSVLFRATNLGQPLVDTKGSGGSVTHTPLPDVAGITIANGSSAGLTFNGQTGAKDTNNKGILPWALVDTDVVNGVGTAFATMDTTTNPLDSGGSRVPGLNPIRALRPSEQSSILTTNANLNLFAPFALAATQNFNSVSLRTGGGLSATALFQITLSSGGILADPGNLGITGGILNAAAGSAPLNIWTPGAATSLTISSSLAGGQGAANAGLIKAGAGLLILSGPQSFSIPGLSANTLNAMTVINQGTLRLGSGTNTLFPNTFLNIGPAGTLDLAGNAQWVQTLFSDGAVTGGGGVVTSSTGTGTLVSNNDNTARAWAGSIQGAVAFSRGGQNTLTLHSNNPYTGVTQVNGGTTLLRDAAAFSGTSALDVNFATLTLDSGIAGTMNSSDRVNNAAPVSLRGGTLNLAGRPQTETSETMGDLTIAPGLATITANASSGLAATGIFSADLTFGDGVGASLSRQAGGVVNFVGQTNATATTLGLIGNGSRILFTNAPTLTNRIIGPWAIVTTSTAPEYASFVPTMGVGALGTAGFAGYDGIVLPASDQPMQNFRLTAVGAVPVTGRTVHTLNLVGFGLSYTSDTSTLTLAGGGLMHSGASASIGAVGAGTRGQLSAGTTIAPSELVIYNGTNTLTINSRIVNNASLGPVSLVLSGTGTVTMASQTSNTHTGGTSVNNGLAVNTTGAAAGVVVFPTGGLTLNSAALTLTAAGQIAPGTAPLPNVVTLNGSSTLNLVGDNTLGGLAFNNFGGTANPVINTGGILTLRSGTAVSATSSNVTTTSVVAGRLALPIGMTTFNIAPVVFNNVDVALTLTSFIMQGLTQSPGAGTAGITKTGAGILQFNAQALFTGQVDVQDGGVQFAIPTNGGLSGSRFANLNLGAASTRLNLNTGSGIFGSLSGVAGSAVTNSTVGGQTLTVGFDNTSTTFAGRFARFGDGAPATVNITKIGTGEMLLTGANSDSTATLSIQGGTVRLSGAADTSFSANNVLSGGTLTLDNASVNKNNRLGGQGENNITLTISGGTVRLIGNSAVDTSETINTFTVSSGAGVLDLQPHMSRKLSARVLTTFSGIQVGGTLFIKNLPTLPDPNVPLDGEASILLPATATSLNAPAGFGFTDMELAVRPDIVVAVGSGPASSFLTKDVFNNLLRPLAPPTAPAPEVKEFMLSGAQSPINYDLSFDATIFENTRGYSLVLRNGMDLIGAAPAPLGSYGPNATLLTQELLSGGILVVEGATSSISVGLLNTGPNVTVPLTIHAYGNLTLTANVGTGTGGFTKSGTGTLTLNGRGFYTGVTTVNAGTMTLNGPQDNSIAVVPGATTALTSALTLNGGVLDLKDRSQAFGTLSSNNPNAGVAGVVTNSTGTTITLTSSTATASSFRGQITGPINFVKTGAGVLTLANPSTYTGTTTIRGGGIVLRDSASLLSTSGIDLNYGALTIDHTLLNTAGNLTPNRLPTNVPISMFGATLQLNAGGSADYALTLTTTVNLLGGANTFTSQIPAGSGSTAVLTLGGLNRPNSFATANFLGNNGTLGNAGFNPRTVFTSTTGVALTNKIIGGWAVTAGGDFATTKGTAPTIDIGGLGNTGGGFQAYDGTDITSASTLPAWNVNDGTTRTLATSKTINALRVGAGVTHTLGSTGVPVTLTLGSGGLLKTGDTAYQIAAGDVGSALTSGISELFVFVNQNTTTIGAKIINGAANPLGMNLVKSGGGNLVLTGSNTYTGTTVVNQGTLTLSNIDAGVAVPGNLLINNATTTLTLAGQLQATASVTIDGSGRLNLAGTNTLTQVVFNNRGGNAAPIIAPTPVTSGPLTSSNLILSNGGVATPSITATNDVFSTTPAIGGTSLALPHAQPVISTSGVATTSLLVTAPIHSVGGAISKVGAGSVVFDPDIALTATTTGGPSALISLATTTGLAVGMSVSGTGIAAGSLIEQIPDGTNVLLSLATTAAGTNTINFTGSTYANGLTVSEGTLILAANSVLDPALPLNPTVINGPVGKGTLTLAHGASIMSDTVLRTLHNNVSVQGDFTFGTPAGSTATALAGNGVNLAGPMTLTAGPHSIAVNGPLNVSTISGVITGSGTLTKTGPGTLRLAGDGNNWGGPLVVAAGVLRNGTAGAVPAGIDLTVSTGAIFDTPGVNQVLKTLTGGGAVTNSSTALGATLYVGGTSTTDTTTVVNNTFDGSIAGIIGDSAAALPAPLNLTKVGAGTFTLSGANTYRGLTEVNSGTLRVSITGSLTIADTFSVNNGATAEINGSINAVGSGSVQTLGAGSRIRGSGSIGALTTISPEGIIEPVVGVGTMTMSSVLTLEDGATLHYATNLANQNRISIAPGGFANVVLPTGTGWTLTISNANITNPQGMKFVLFDGPAGGTLNGNSSSSDDFVGNPILDFTGTNWSLNPALGAANKGVHYDFANNDIVLIGVIPEPSSGSMLLGSLAVALGLQRFRRRRT